MKTRLEDWEGLSKGKMIGGVLILKRSKMGWKEKRKSFMIWMLGL